ncbi:MAG: hypothetical protein IJV08_01965 [Bacteroidaceae bacterium]|nr:hypothetical protein [Bacteroidaceae bacterium]
MKRFLLLTVCCLTALGCWAQASDEYVPFVSKLKTWHVLGFCVGPYTSDKFYYFGNKDVAIGEHTYLNLYEKDLSNWDEEYWDEGQDDEEAISLGLFREEDRRVYLYDEETGYEHCVYDFNLQEGDVFDIGWGNEADRCVVTAIGEEVIANQHLRTITFSSVDTEQGGKGGHEEHTWVEGIGDTSRPDYGWIGNYRVSSWSYHVAYMTMLNDEYVYCPLSFYGAWGSNNHVIGQNVVKGEEMQPESYKGQYLLDYEIINNQLHVKGYMWMQSCPDYYIYCKVSPHEGNYSKYQIVLTLEEVMPHTDCISTPHAVDLYFNAPIFEESYEFVVIDYDGEHAVPQRSSDYRPFVSKLKQWHVLGFCVGPFSSVDDYTFAETEVEKDGKNYLPLLKNWERYDGNVKPDTCGLFREEGRRVYLYDQGTEFCVYDFTLEVGDTFDIGWGTEADRCVVTEVGEIAVKDRHLRTITFSSVDAARGGKGLHQNHTWIEGIGDRSRPDYGWVSNYVPSDWTYDVAYVLTDYREGDINGFYPFNVCSLWGTSNWVIGQELAKGEQCTSEPEGYRERASLLDYEIVDNRLHVSGYADISSGPNNYIYCKVSPYNGSPDAYQITLKEEEVAPKQDGFTINSVDWNFEAPIFGEPYKFIAIDDDGEHAVPQRSYRPFVEDGKVWKVGLFESEALNAYQLQYYYFENDTTIEDQMQKSLTGKKLMRRTEDEDTRKTEYIATIHEEGRHVFHFSPNDFVWTMTYDFASEAREVVFFGSPVYPHTEFWGTIDSKSFIEDACYKGVATKVSIKDLGGEQVEWLEGVGTRISPVNNIGRLLPEIEAEALLSCTVGNDTLFHNPRYTEEISTVWEAEEEAEVKKEKIDFTHVVKTKPTVPRKVAANGAQEAQVGAEVSELSLDITFSGLSGSYTVSLRNEADEQVFAQRMETDNLRSLDVRLTDYEAGRYTVTVENDQEAYFASFHFEGSAIRPVGSDATEAPLYDLTGRRLSLPPARGLYIHNGKKHIVR